MERLLIAAVLVVLAVAVAAVVERRRGASAIVAATGRPPGYRVPSYLDRQDFERPEAPWLVAVFSSTTCDACGEALGKAGVLASEVVAVSDVEVGAAPELHAKYEIDAVPIIVIADAEGDVRAAFAGAPSSADLWAAMAEVREPGSMPEGCDAHGAVSGAVGSDESGP